VLHSKEFSGVKDANRDILDALPDDFAWKDTRIDLRPSVVELTIVIPLRLSDRRIRRDIVGRYPVSGTAKRLVIPADFGASPWGVPYARLLGAEP
jgi:hypothetical protein